MADHWQLFIASRNGQRVAASLIALDPAGRIAYGRYWGATEHVPLLHFEACYYQPLAWCSPARAARIIAAGGRTPPAGSSRNRST